ncbi:vegetative cell wall protein gp1 [Phlyctema vagabunda]|uniref:Vegetative cell wall protein gp1 n=1 Tax=Phlyctema vagabunda TaxID=108571 RepID=A0ABR4PB99_9HELO
MNNPYSPYSPSPGHGAYYPFSASPSPAASPSGHHGFFQRPGPSPRHHARHTSYGDTYSQSPKAFSPRYTSSGYYATANVSRNKSSWSAPRHEKPKASKRRNSYSHQRASYEDSDEDDDVEFVYYMANGVLYRETVRPARRPTKTSHNYHGHGTDHYYYQDAYDRDHLQSDPSRSRRNSSSTPQRPRTSSRPTTTSPKKPAPVPKATEADARRHRIPPGYSLKNWDPSEEPIMLLGSVFDANSLGKWVYDWTVYHHGPATPIADMAGELWLLLIQLAGKVKRSEECMPRIRKADNREMIEDFIESGERLMDKLKKLLKSCETPMLKAGKKHSKDSAQLGKNAGTEFVDSIFGRDRQLDSTEKFMASIRLWNLRFDANCEDILRNPRD